MLMFRPIVLFISLVSLSAVSGCATKTYGRQSALTEFERKTMTCREISLEMAKTQGFMDHISKESEFSGRDVLAFMGDFGIGNSMERTSATESASKRMSELQSLSASKNCLSGEGSTSHYVPQPASLTAAPPGVADQLQELERLLQLRVITGYEYRQRKQKLLEAQR